jgi:RNA polymerase sigma-70 factor (ECF subfamily)
VPHTAVELEDWLKESYDTSYRTAYVLVGNPTDAQDAVQEAFLRVWRFRDSLKNRADYRPWLYRVLVNACYSHMRREIRHRDRRASADALDEVLTPDRTTRFDARSDVARAVANLSVDLRAVVLLRYFAELSEREIATAIDRPVGTVKSRLNEARRRLSQDPFLHDGDTAFTIDTEVASDHE